MVTSSNESRRWLSRAAASRPAKRREAAGLTSLLVLACDLPRVPAGLLAALTHPAAADWSVPRWRGSIEPLCALYGPAALAALVAPHATVVRDGRAREVPVERIALGDLVRLGAGELEELRAVFQSLSQARQGADELVELLFLFSQLLRPLLVAPDAGILERFRNGVQALRLGVEVKDTSADRQRAAAIRKASRQAD